MGSPFTDREALREAIAIGIGIDEFLGMTPFELGLMFEGYKVKADRELRIVAWHICNTVNVHLPRGKQVSMNKLLPKKGLLEASSFLSKDDMLEAARATWEEVRKDKGSRV